MSNKISIWWDYLLPRGMADISILKTAQSKLIKLGTPWDEAGKILSEVHQYYVDAACEAVKNDEALKIAWDQGFAAGKSHDRLLRNGYEPKENPYKE